VLKSDFNYLKYIGIYRHALFKIRFRKKWRFKSVLRYHY